MAVELHQRQLVISRRGVKSKTMIINTDVPQGSKVSPTQFSFYIADMPRPIESAKRNCYADDITVWASELKYQNYSIKYLYTRYTKK